MQVAHDAAQGEQTGLLVPVHEPLRYWFAAQLAAWVHGVQYGVLTGVQVPVRYVPPAQLEACVHGEHSRFAYVPSSCRPHEPVS